MKRYSFQERRGICQSRSMKYSKTEASKMKNDVLWKMWPFFPIAMESCVTSRRPVSIQDATWGFRVWGPAPVCLCSFPGPLCTASRRRTMRTAAPDVTNWSDTEIMDDVLHWWLQWEAFADRLWGAHEAHADGSSASLPCAQPSEAGQTTSPAPGMGCWLKLCTVAWSRNWKLVKHRHKEDSQKEQVSSGLL